MSRRKVRDAISGEEEIAEVCIISEHFGGDAGALPDIEGGFEWIVAGTGNNELDKEMRLESAKLTAAACRMRRYSYDETEVRLKYIEEMKRGTKFVESASSSSSSSRSAARIEWKFHDDDTTDSITMAVDTAMTGQRTVLLNPASAYIIGGAFSKGGKAGLEECLCFQSSLHTSLLQASELPPQRGLSEAYIPDNSVVLSPQVEVFRGGAEDGFPFEDETTVLTAVVSVAMPNNNPKLKDVPVDRPASEDQYLNVVRAKLTAALVAASSVKASILVVPALGVGDYKNKPEVIGRELAKVVSEKFSNAFEQIHVVGPRAFTDACSHGVPMPGSSPTMAMAVPVKQGGLSSAPMATATPVSRSGGLGMGIAPPAGNRSRTAGGRPAEEMERHLRALKTSVSEISGEFVQTISKGESSLGKLNPKDIQKTREEIKREKARLRDELEVIRVQKQDIQEQHAEVAQTKEQLILEVEESMRNEGKGNCTIC
mmetsp:Transcript_66743/g.118078  ORF Transcript_66743/g.118078 Transcript_66743/m.118078 type:complete len:485 (-) Transcript_66743:87-1541(-)